ncbi:MerR family DNA-binding transcriptional regulator [Saccharopolyspora spinosa]
MLIGELARRAGTTTKAVRNYESLGLITPGRLPKRLAGLRRGRPAARAGDQDA